jgi:hypothetical protein
MNNEIISNLIAENRNEKGQLDYKIVKFLNDNGVYLHFTNEGIYWRNKP